MASNPFNRYGTRTPCLLATPLLQKGSVVRPQGSEDSYPFDHCSVIRTVLDLFVGPDAYLTDRDYFAPSFAPCLLTQARPNLGFQELACEAPPPGEDHDCEEPPPGVGKRKDNKRWGCHSVKHLMEMSSQYEGGS